MTGMRAARTQADVTRAVTNPAAQGRLEGEIWSEPGSVEDLVLVRVPVPGGKAQEYGPLRWGPEREGLLPEKGDRCLIEQAANTRQWFVVCWWPLAYEQP